MGLSFFDAARHFDRPTEITEVPADFAEHGRHGERQEIRALVDVEAVDRIDQAQPGGLNKIVERFTPASVSAGDVVGNRQEALDNPLALALTSERAVIKRLEGTEHFRDVCIL